MDMAVSERGVATWEVPRGASGFDRWRSLLCDAFLEMAADRRSADGFFGVIELVDDPFVKLTRVRSADITASRDRRQAAEAASERVYVIHLLAGHATITQRRRDVDLAPGGVVVVDGSIPFVLDFHTPHDVFSYQLERSTLVGPTLSDVTQRRALGPSDPTVALMIQQMHALHALRSRPSHRRVIGSAFRDLVRLALRGDDHLPDSASVRTSRRQCVLDMVDAGFRQPDLTPGRVAADLGVTTRYIHALLETTGRSFSEHVRQRRLDWVAEVLRSDRNATVAAVAADAGFGDLSTFYRQFRHRFGASPGEYRRAAPAAPSGT